MSQIAVESMPDLAASDVEKSTMRAVSWRLLPFLIIAYFTCVLDRVNVSFAALTMNADLGFTPLVYAWGAGIFFIGYFLLEVPSNIALHRFGARRWIARIMITWGLISAATAFVTGPYSFYTIRFLLGVAEAGFFPGIILYLTYWYPEKYRARVMSAFIVGAPLSAVLGGPLCGALLEMHNIGSFKGWQWLFLVEGIMPVLLGFVAFFYLTDKPASARWLTSEQKTWLETELANEQRKKHGVDAMTLREALSSPKVLALGFVYFGLLAGLYGIQFWLPQIVKGFGLTNMQIGFVSAVPFAFGTVAMLLWGPAIRQGEGARLACGAAAVSHRCITRGFGLCRQSRADDGCIGSRQHRRLRGVRIVLDVADRLSQRCGGGRRNCFDQFDRQSLGIWWSLSDRLDQGSDRQHGDGPARARNSACGCGPYSPHT